MNALEAKETATKSNQEKHGKIIQIVSDGIEAAATHGEYCATFEVSQEAQACMCKMLSEQGFGVFVKDKATMEVTW